jgi:hypothetical protein
MNLKLHLGGGEFRAETDSDTFLLSTSRIT